MGEMKIGFVYSFYDSEGQEMYSLSCNRALVEYLSDTFKRNAKGYIVQDRFEEGVNALGEYDKLTKALVEKPINTYEEKSDEN